MLIQQLDNDFVRLGRRNRKQGTDIGSGAADEEFDASLCHDAQALLMTMGVRSSPVPAAIRLGYGRASSKRMTRRRGSTVSFLPASWGQSSIWSFRGNQEWPFRRRASLSFPIVPVDAVERDEAYELRDAEHVRIVGCYAAILILVLSSLGGGLSHVQWPRGRRQGEAAVRVGLVAALQRRASKGGPPKRGRGGMS